MGRSGIGLFIFQQLFHFQHFTQGQVFWYQHKAALAAGHQLNMKNGVQIADRNLLRLLILITGGAAPTGRMGEGKRAHGCFSGSTMRWL